MDNIERYREMKALSESGASLRQIAGKYNISHQRVSQILSGPEPKTTTGRPSKRWEWTTQVKPGIPLLSEKPD